MGTHNKTKVRLVISHFEGCSGNFLAYLAAHQSCAQENIFRVDRSPNSEVLSINGRHSWHQEIEQRLEDHSVVVTHNFHKDLIMETFPHARILQIYPYTCAGNVLYNICAKKLDVKIENQVDNHLINLSEWYERMQDARPDHMCYDFAQLWDLQEVERMLETDLTPDQAEFFNRYWQQQLTYRLDLPRTAMTITELVRFWQIEDFCNPWSLAWVIFVFERCNHLSETDRLWSIDDQSLLQDWDTLRVIENRYRAHSPHNRIMS